MIAAAWRAWERFWFRPEPISPLILFRIAYGVIVFLWVLSALPDAATLFGSGGVLPAGPHTPGSWSVLDVWSSDAAAVFVVALLGVAGLCVALGAFTRPASVLVFVCLVSLGSRNPFVGNSGDALLRTLSLYLLLSPAGAAVSIDALRRGRDRVFEIPSRPPVALRLIQVQISILYVSTVWAKLRGELWPHGKAVAFALRLDDLGRFPVPDIGRSALVIHVMTFGVLVIEASLGVLVWKRVLRPWVLLGGVCLHLGIEYRLRVGFFSWAILTSYLAFVTPAAAGRVLDAVRARLRSAPWRESASTP